MLSDKYRLVKREMAMVFDMLAGFLFLCSIISKHTFINILYIFDRSCGFNLHPSSYKG